MGRLLVAERKSLKGAFLLAGGQGGGVMGKQTKRSKRLSTEEMEFMGVILSAAEILENMAKFLRAALSNNLRKEA